MNLIFAVLYVSPAMGLTGCYKTECFFTFIFAFFSAILLPLLSVTLIWG